jgi:hypothetical protein
MDSKKNINYKMNMKVFFSQIFCSSPRFLGQNRSPGKYLGSSGKPFYGIALQGGAKRGQNLSAVGLTKTAKKRRSARGQRAPRSRRRYSVLGTGNR